MTACTPGPISRWGQWEWNVSPPPAQDPLLPHFLPLSSGLRARDRSCGERDSALAGRAAPCGLPSAGTHPPATHFAGADVGFPVSLSPPRTPNLRPGSRGASGRRARRTNPSWARQSVVTAAALPRPLANSASPRRARHLLNPLSLGRSRRVGPRGAGRIGQKLPRPRAADRPAQRSRTRSRGQMPALAAELDVPFHRHGSRQAPSGTKARPHPSGVRRLPRQSLHSPNPSQFPEEPPAPGSHRETEGGSPSSRWPGPRRSCVSIFLSKKTLWTADNTRRYETASSPTCCT